MYAPGDPLQTGIPGAPFPQFGRRSAVFSRAAVLRWKRCLAPSIMAGSPGRSSVNPRLTARPRHPAKKGGRITAGSAAQESSKGDIISWHLWRSRDCNVIRAVHKSRTGVTTSRRFLPLTRRPVVKPRIRRVSHLCPRSLHGTVLSLDCVPYDCRVNRRPIFKPRGQVPKLNSTRIPEAGKAQTPGRQKAVFLRRQKLRRNGSNTIDTCVWAGRTIPAACCLLVSNASSVYIMPFKKNVGRFEMIKLRHFLLTKKKQKHRSTPRRRELDGNPLGE